MLGAVAAYGYVNPVLTERAAAWCRRQGAFDVADARGGALGAGVLSAGLGHTAPIWVGAALALLGTGIAVVARTADRHDRTAVCTSASADEAVPVESRTAA